MCGGKDDLGQNAELIKISDPVYVLACHLALLFSLLIFVGNKVSGKTM